MQVICQTLAAQLFDIFSFVDRVGDLLHQRTKGSPPPNYVSAMLLYLVDISCSAWITRQRKRKPKLKERQTHSYSASLMCYQAYSVFFRSIYSLTRIGNIFHAKNVFQGHSPVANDVKRRVVGPRVVHYGILHDWSAAAVHGRAEARARPTGRVMKSRASEAPPTCKQPFSWGNQVNCFASSVLAEMKDWWDTRIESAVFIPLSSSRHEARTSGRPLPWWRKEWTPLEKRGEARRSQPL